MPAVCSRRRGALVARRDARAWSESLTATGATSIVQRYRSDDRRVLWLVIGGFWLFNIAVSAVQIYVTVRVNGSPPPLGMILRWLVPGYSVWLASTPAIVALTRRYGFEGGRWRSSFVVHSARHAPPALQTCSSR